MGSRPGPALHRAATAPRPRMSPEGQQDTVRCWFVFILPWASEKKDYTPVHCQLAAAWGRCREAVVANLSCKFSSLGPLPSDHLMVRSARSAPPPCPPLSKGVVCREPFAWIIPKGGKEMAAYV